MCQNLSPVSSPGVVRLIARDPQCTHTVPIHPPPVSAVHRGWWEGSSGPRFAEWSLARSTCFPPCRLFLSFSFRVLDPWSIFFHFLTCFFLTATSTVSYIRRLLLSCATSPLYHPLCRSEYICRSIARIRLFINYGTSLLLSIHVPNPVLRCRAAPLHQKVDKLICVVIAVGYSMLIALFPRP